MRSLVGSAVAWTLLALASPVAARSVCPDARYVSRSAIVTGSASGAFDIVALEDGRLSIGSGCAPARVRTRLLRDGTTRLRARWKRCGALRRVRFHGRISDAGSPCRRLDGVLRARGGERVTVYAQRSACGDNVVDAALGERCDPPGRTCDPACLPIEPPTCPPGFLRVGDGCEPEPPPCPPGEVRGEDGCAPVETPERTWTWIDVPGTACANGTTTGMGVNPGTPGGRLVVFLMGGGACWNAATCYEIGTATNMDGYGAGTFRGDALGLLSTSLFDRTDADNPFRDDSFVFVPYCTGDVHAGSNPDAVWDGRPTRHVGFRNVTALLPVILARVPQPSRVLLAGSSAGGDVRVDLLDDSGPTLPPAWLSEPLEQAWRTAWRLDVSLPPGCLGCAQNLDAIVDHYGAVFPDHRAALLARMRDGVIGYFYAQSGDGVESGLLALTARMAGLPLWRHFLVPGGGHVVLTTPDLVVNGTSLRTFLRQMVEDDPAWMSVGP